MVLNSKMLSRVFHDAQSQRTQDQSSKSTSSKSGPTIESAPDPDQDMTTSIKTGTKQMKLAPDKSLGLDQAILHSINCCSELNKQCAVIFCQFRDDSFYAVSFKRVS